MLVIYTAVRTILKDCRPSGMKFGQVLHGGGVLNKKGVLLVEAGTET